MAGISGGYYIYAGMAIGAASILALPIRPAKRTVLIVIYLPVSYLVLFFRLMVTRAILASPW